MSPVRLCLAFATSGRTPDEALAVLLEAAVELAGPGVGGPRGAVRAMLLQVQFELEIEMKGTTNA
jgi:hypothetical protein